MRRLSPWGRVSRTHISILCSALAITALVPLAAAAPLEPAVAPSPPPPPPLGDSTQRQAGLKLAAGDTIYVFGGPDRADGKFQADGNRLVVDDQGWIPLGQSTDPADAYWHVDTFNAATLDLSVAGNHAMWCGRYFPPCDNEPENPGYANLVKASLGWSRPVTDPQLATTVHLTARLNHDTEPGYDYLYLEVERSAGWDVLATWDGDNRAAGVFVPIDVDLVLVVDPADYVGGQGDEVHLRWRFASDGGYSDADCLFQGDGAAQVDNIVVSFDQGSGPITVTEDDFEPGGEPSWAPEHELCSLARVWTTLPDAGVCGSNPTPQVAFLDDGAACFSDGSYGTDWTYGPQGLVAYCPAGGFTNYQDAIWSPPISLPPDVATYDGALLEWDAYVHGTTTGTPFVDWHVRTSEDGGASWSAWRSHGFVYEQHGPEYRRFSFDVSAQIPATADLVQISLGVANISHFTDCGFMTPAPYYDNVALKLFRRSGPEVLIGTLPGATLFQSAFPASGDLDPADPGSHSVRLDATNNDYAACWTVVQRAGAVRDGPAEMHWRLSPNPAYDAHRGPPPPNPVPGDSISVLTDMFRRPTVRYAFDLPDSGFFFPGDVLHYYFAARDDAAGDIGLATLPGDTSGFASFPGQPGYVPGRYPQWFEVRALPDLHDPAAGTQPPLLVWLADQHTEQIDEWLTALANLGYRHGEDFDLLRPPAENVVEFTAAQLAGYDIIVYSSGRISNVFNSTVAEADVLEAWLALGGRNLLLCGDNIVRRFYPYYTYWYASILGVAGYGPFPYDDVRPFIENQAAPGVLPVAGNPVGLTVEAIADGTCYYNLFDAMTPDGTGQAILEWAGPDGSPGGYAPVAGVHNLRADWDSRIVTLPFDLAFAATPLDQAGGPTAARTRILGEILASFGGAPGGSPTGVPEAGSLSLRTYPSPFNPRLTVEYDLPRAGRVTLRAYDVRGRLVAELADAVQAAGQHRLYWDGRTDAGSAAAAGLYFVQVRQGKEQVVRRVVVVR